MITRNCWKCGQEHELAYIFHKNSTKHLVLLHKNKKGKRSDIYLPFEDNLDIPIVETKAQKLKGSASPLFSEDLLGSESNKSLTQAERHTIGEPQR